MISTVAAGKNGEAVQRTGAVPDRAEEEGSADDNINETKMIGLLNEIELNCTLVAQFYQG